MSAAALSSPPRSGLHSRRHASLPPSSSQVLNDLRWNLARPQAMEAVMRLRCSQGLDVASYVGHFYRMPANPTDVHLPAVDSDKAVVCNLQVRA